jgi:predicted nucleic acid-binding protein
VIGLDTSAVVRLLIGEPVAQAAAARALVEANAGETFVSDLVVAESYFALRHHYEVPHAHAVGALRALLEGGRVRPAGVALDVLRDAASSAAAPGIVDRLIHAGYVAEGMELHTFDRAAAKLQRAKLIG